jgi:hypothetical protein
MRKSQQTESRRRTARINRMQAENRRLRRWWKAMILAPLRAIRQNSRAGRWGRMVTLTGGRKPELRQVKTMAAKRRAKKTPARDRWETMLGFMKKENRRQDLLLRAAATALLQPQPTAPGKERWPRPRPITAQLRG